MYKEGDLVEAMAYLLQDIKKIKINKVKEWEKKYFRSAAALTKQIDNLKEQVDGYKALVELQKSQLWELRQSASQLEKTKNFVMGNYGKKEHLWCLPKKQESFNQSTLPI